MVYIGTSYFRLSFWWFPNVSHLKKMSVLSIHTWDNPAWKTEDHRGCWSTMNMVGRCTILAPVFIIRLYHSKNTKVGNSWHCMLVLHKNHSAILFLIWASRIIELPWLIGSYSGWYLYYLYNSLMFRGFVVLCCFYLLICHYCYYHCYYCCNNTAQQRVYYFVITSYKPDLLFITIYVAPTWMMDILFW